MPSVRIEVLSGSRAESVFEPEGDVVRIGRGPKSDLELPEAHVSSEHARLVIGDDTVTLEDLRSTNGTAVVRGDDRVALDEGNRKSALEDGDIVELGGEGDEATRLRISVAEELEPHVADSFALLMPFCYSIDLLSTAQ